MKNGKQFIHALGVLTLSTGFLIFISGCSSESSLPTPKTEFTGEDLVRGVFFADGDVAAAIPIINNTFRVETFFAESDQIERIRRFQNEVIETVKIKYPGSFEDFKAAVGSGDHLVIQKAIQHFGQLLFSVAEDLYGSDLIELIRENKPVFIKAFKELKNEDFESTKAGIAKMADEDLINNLEAGLFAPQSREKPGVQEECAAVVLVLGGAVAVVLYVVEAVAFWTDIGIDWADGPFVGGSDPNTTQLYAEMMIEYLAQLDNT